jgi:hypothetical protein
MLHSKHFQTYQLAILIWILVASSCAVRSEGSPVQSQNPSIIELRAEYAMRFLEPAPHMALAKYFRDKGNRLEAFYILETARRSRLEEDEFNQAFALNAW